MEKCRYLHYESSYSRIQSICRLWQNGKLSGGALPQPPNNHRSNNIWGAHGADALAERLASEYEIPTEIYKADWAQYGKRAGYIRNRLIIAACDICVAFWDGKSKGTKMDIDLCKELGKECIICLYNSGSTSPSFQALCTSVNYVFKQCTYYLTAYQKCTIFVVPKRVRTSISNICYNIIFLLCEIGII